ncbi:metal-dependent hydrolase [archaeon]|jgi:inner membrane protein|nr:metal-dependent hydrolase [archaeon]MBT6697787.1 metal-dependent hydrolase [archaeon]
MLFYGHVLLGILAFLLLKLFGVFSIFGDSGFMAFLLMGIFVFIGALLPDIDEANSKVNKWSGPIGKIVAALFKHRGILHSVLLFFVLSLVVWKLVGQAYGIALFAGYLAHILGDSITPMGVKIFIPFSEFKIKGPIRVGSIWEKFLWGVLVLVNAILFWKVLI